MRYDSDFVIHCKPNGLCEIVGALKGAQEEDVKAVGCGGMLRISGISVTKTDLIRWLVERFNGRSQMLTISNRAMMGRRTSLLVIFEKTCLDCIYLKKHVLIVLVLEYLITHVVVVCFQRSCMELVICSMYCNRDNLSLSMRKYLCIF
ncbi:hypothetical protein CASFOL_000720 [Castilleja foliolosa]|uniref:Uncharacterized protein n=1 Tax=Castilleja foliolosa TaxID=1961234 RepID=A0ABD3EPB3_9LAMI